jgi:hypothetical protein
MTAKVIQMEPKVAINEQAQGRPDVIEEFRRLLLRMGQFVRVAGDFEGQN